MSGKGGPWRAMWKDELQRWVLVNRESNEVLFLDVGRLTKNLAKKLNRKEARGNDIQKGGQ